VLFSADPERAHHLAMDALRIASASRASLLPLRRFQPPGREVHAFGLTFPNPIGLAAGFDKNAVALPRGRRSVSDS
jgi:dihydroorotate dehydrogenase